MSPVRRLIPHDISVVANLARQHLAHHAMKEPLVCDDFDRREFERTLSRVSDPIWVREASGVIRGHLFGATMADGDGEQVTWTGPDGWSFDYEDDLDGLLKVALPYWREEGSSTHIVWSPAGSETEAWVQRGYSPFSVRAALAIEEKDPPTIRSEFNGDLTIRHGTLDDLDTALQFDLLIDASHGVDTATLSEQQRSLNTKHLTETLEDPETLYYILELDGVPIAQCITFPLPSLRGTHDGTIYLSDIAVAEGMRNRGYGRYLVRAVLNDALAQGYAYAEVRWRLTNLPGQMLWSSMGFHPIYAQLRRQIND